MRVPGLIAESIATSTQPSAPKPVASATSGPNSSTAQRKTASGGALSNLSEINLSSSSVIVRANDWAEADIRRTPLISCESVLQLFIVGVGKTSLEPFETLA